MRLRFAAMSALLALALVVSMPSPALALSSWFEEFSRTNAEETAKQASEHETKERETRERETAARHATEEAEQQQKAKEEAQRAANEVIEREEKAREASGCVVPSVAGDSLNTASNTLRSAHCRLGKVTRPRGIRGPMVVTRQSYKHGTRLAQGTAVAVSLGRKRRR
jgi:flagellar biosynthesis component FlhA